MKINHYNQAMKWITRPKEKKMPIVDYIKTMNRLYGSDGGAVEAPHGTEPDYIPPKEMLDIKKSLPVSEMVKKEERFNDKILKRDKYETPKKKIIKKTLIVEKPKPNQTPILSLLELEDWLNEIDPNWVDEKPNEEVLLRVPRHTLKGLASILKVG